MVRFIVRTIDKAGKRDGMYVVDTRHGCESWFRHARADLGQGTMVNIPQPC
jgi:hypothetical protein